MKLGGRYRRLFAASAISNLGDGVGLIAYPWLASAVTRNPVLIAVVAAAQRLPWLVFTLPAGVITDRYDRRRIMVACNSARAVLTAFVATAVLWRGNGLPGPDELDRVVGTELVLYLCVLVATVLLGTAEVLHDNSAQTLIPSIVDTENLEKANGRLWAAEVAANQFAGPPLAAVLLGIGFAVPFIVDAGTFAVSAALIFTIAATPRSTEPPERKPWKQELGDGFRWLWNHDVLRPMAIILGMINLITSMTWAIFVLFAQEVVDASRGEFAALLMAGAVGGVLGGWTGSWLSRRLGAGRSLMVALLAGPVTDTVVATATNVPTVLVATFAFAYVVFLWNVVTVSFRQTIIPDRLLGRVNSVYRFFAWGTMPIGSVAGGVIVALTEAVADDRRLALRMPFAVSAAIGLAVFAYARPRLTTEKLEAARAAASGTEPVTEPAPT